MGYKVAHIGAFDFENYGDLLFTDVLEKQLRKRIEVDEIVYFAPKTCEMPNRKINVYSVTQLEKLHKINKFDAIVVGGGDLVHLQKIITYMPHLSDEWIIYEVLYMWVIPSIVSWKYEVPLIWNAPGVPMNFSELDKNIVRALCQCVDYISVRDEQARKMLSTAYDKENIKVVPDTVLSISNLIKKEELLPIFRNTDLGLTEKKYVFFQCNVALNDEDFDNCAKALLQIKQEAGYKILLQPIGYALGDGKCLEKMKQMYPNEFILSDKHFTQYEILALVAHAALYIGTSLHGCITATSYGTDNIVYNLNHYNKTDGFVELIQNESARVYDSKDIWFAYCNLSKKRDLSIYFNRIEKHFDLMAQIIEEKKQKKDFDLATAFAEYIYQSRETVEQQIKTNKSLADEIEIKERELEELKSKLKAEQFELENYRKAYETISNSSAWKITKPLRRLKDLTRESNKRKM